LKNIVLLTATVSPPAGVPALSITDPEERYKEYITAFEFYLNKMSQGIDGLLFIENSGADISEFREIASRREFYNRVECLSFLDRESASGHGRAYGEFRIIDYAMRASSFVREYNRAIVWKVSGRYKIINIERLISSTPKNCDFVCNCRNLPIRWVDMYLIGWNRRGYEACIDGVYSLLDEEKIRVPPEIVWRDRVDAAARHLRVVRRFRVVPIISGRRGFDGTEYDGLRYRLKTRARAFALRFLPFLWI
jgi:hypothetical protein